MIIEPLPQDIQGQERVNVIVDQKQEPQEGSGGTAVFLAMEAVFQREDDFQMSVHSDLGLSYGFPLLSSMVWCLHYPHFGQDQYGRRFLGTASLYFFGFCYIGYFRTVLPVFWISS